MFDKIGSGAAVDTNELSAVLPALVVEGVLENVRFALEHGADPNRPTDAAHPFSALYAAVNLGKLEIVQVRSLLRLVPTITHSLTVPSSPSPPCSCCSTTAPRS